ncbi:MAG: nitrate/sulfonate/bicarbonate ABC transporter ATP-binding protein [Rhodospirillaceae bacterium]|nr:nitrate/sulfonate/bicarbonate ABC transporter ATP-binding protein [Rhodospirillaceae bacterium]|tara:strand:+ start:309 stop:1064 length:756 start_codon:yes stop_codon:yes gene_type:complete
MITRKPSRKDNLSASAGVIINNLHFRYKNKILFDNLSLTFPANKTTALLGNNGIGKSSLLKLISGIEKPSSGSITDYNYRNINELISYMDQFDQLLPWLKINKNITLGYKLRREPFCKDRYNYLTKILGLSEYLNFMPSEVSGGTKQRAALARTFLENRPIVLMDEPFTSLDTVTKNKLKDLTKKLIKNKTMILVTHDIMEAIEISDQIIIIKNNPVIIHKIFSNKEITKYKNDHKLLIDLYNKVLKSLDE